MDRVGWLVVIIAVPIVFAVLAVIVVLKLARLMFAVVAILAVVGASLIGGLLAPRRSLPS
jgi:hypothetical protein